MDLNSVSLTARLTRDPEGRTTPSGTSVCRMRIAVNGFTGNGEPKADYLDVVVFGRQAESCGQYLHKGSRVCVAGHLANNEWSGCRRGRFGRGCPTWMAGRCRCRSSRACSGRRVGEPWAVLPLRCWAVLPSSGRALMRSGRVCRWRS